MVQRKSTVAKKLAGTLRESNNYSGLDYVPRDPIGDPPSDFTQEQQDYWWETVGASPAELITEADRPALEQLCIARSIADDCARQLEKDGSVVTLPNGIMAVHPAAKLLRTQQSVIGSMASLLGLTPTTRRRIKRPESHSDEQFEENPFAKWTDDAKWLELYRQGKLTKKQIADGKKAGRPIFD